MNSARGMLSGRWDEAVVEVLIQVADGLVMGEPPSDSMRAAGLTLAPGEMLTLDSLARATADSVAELVDRWRGFTIAEKHDYMEQVLADWKVKKEAEGG